jgi:16S rRNA C967 or C1407 C5-methylase (RsmB/RsmF family)/NOL1/NOP2/fmu family ribosome biogenesis protein
MGAVNFPLAFEKRVQEDPFLGQSLLDALDGEAPVSVRLHPSKTKPALDFLGGIPWCENGFYLKERPSFTLDPLFHAGCYYPQEAGSMVLDTILRSIPLPEEPVVLDLCAAPGGKSTLIASFLKGKGLLVSNEVIHQRSRILKENLAKWGYSNVVVTNNDPKDFERLPNFFDVAVIDAPCSGEGMFRKDPESRNEWSEDNVQLCAARQKRILADVWDTIKPGGYVIYSTCTFNSLENEDNVDFAVNELGAALISIDLPQPIRKGRKGSGHYCIPGETAAEGFFVAVLKKQDGEFRKTKYESKKDVKFLTANALKELKLEEFMNTAHHDFFQWNDAVLAFPSSVSDLMQHVVSKLRIVKAGTIVGEIQRKGINPHHELALHQDLCTFPKRIELEKDQALQYLHGDTFSLSGEHGWQLITYQNQTLGWIKHLGNRFNNLYPKEWRIRMKV